MSDIKSFQNGFLTLVDSLVKVLAVICLTTVFWSCDKDEDDEPPVVDFQMPQDFQIISSVDTVTFVAKVSDNKQVESISIDLQTLDYFNAMSRQRYDVSGTNVNFSTDLFLTEPFLESGQYYFILSASDGVNETRKFVQVQIQAIQREIESYVVVTKQTNSAKVYSSVNYSDWTEKLDLYMDLKGAALNYRQNLLGLVGGEVGDAVFYNIEEYEFVKSIPGFGTPSQPYFLGLTYQPEIERFFLLQNNPQMRVLDKLASGLYACDLPQGFRPEFSVQIDGINYVNQKEITSPNYILGSYSQAGLLFNTYVTDGPVQLISKKSSNELFVWTDGEEGASLSILNTSNNLIAPIYNRPGEALKAAIRLPSGAFLISTSEGLYQYAYSSGGTQILSTSPTPEAFYYDSLEGFIYGTQGNLLIRMTPQGNVVSIKQFDAEIAHFAIDYNR
jgi:hypothetical protein